MAEWTTSDVRAAAIYGPTRDGLQYPEKEVRERLRADGFDRWLTAHDAEVAAKALEDAADAWVKSISMDWYVSSCLRARAATIRAEAQR